MHKSTPDRKNIPTIPMVSITKLKTLSFIIVLFYGFFFKFLSLAGTSIINFRCKGTALNSQNTGVRLKKTKKITFFRKSTHKQPKRNKMSDETG